MGAQQVMVDAFDTDVRPLLMQVRKMSLMKMARLWLTRRAKCLLLSKLP
jgi:L-rhamnose isomerase